MVIFIIIKLMDKLYIKIEFLVVVIEVIEE